MSSEWDSTLSEGDEVAATEVEAAIEAEAAASDVPVAEVVDEVVEELAAADEAAADDDGDVLPPVDPVQAFKDDLAAKFGDWYVIHTYAGYENRVKANLENRIISLNMEDYIFEIQVPL